jgi:hypothetical protein
MLGSSIAALTVWVARVACHFELFAVDVDCHDGRTGETGVLHGQVSEPADTVDRPRRPTPDLADLDAL